MTHVRVAFLDIGQGDCTVAIDEREAKAIVIDCAEGTAELAIQALGEADIALFIITHLHADHMGDALELARRRNAAEVLINTGRRVPKDVSERSKLTAALRAFAALEDDGTVVNRPALAGMSSQVGDIAWHILWPRYGAVLGALGSGTPNRSSVIVRLEAAGRRFLIAGDSDSHDWQRVMESGADVSADVLLVPHHGSEFGKQPGETTLAAVLDAVDARHHILSVGAANTYGHPAASTLKALGDRALHARVTCTEINPVCLGSAATPASPGEGDLAVWPDVRRYAGPPCAGTVAFELLDDVWHITPSESEHDLTIRQLGNPQCRTHARTTSTR